MFSNINVSQGYQAVSCNINILSSVPRIFEAVLRSAHSNDSISNNTLCLIDLKQNILQKRTRDLNLMTKFNLGSKVESTLI